MYDAQDEHSLDYPDPSQLRARRIAARKKRQRQQRRRRLLLLLLFLALLTTAAVIYFSRGTAPVSDTAPAPKEAPEETPETPHVPALTVTRTADTAAPGKTITSTSAILLDADSGTVLAEKAADKVIHPASMTKILTLLVAAEHITDPEDTFSIPIEITDFCYQNECSAVGWLVGDTPTVRDLLYGTILPSGADAALALARYVSGSEEAFVALMNDKLRQWGISDTAHFTNCIGLYDPDHHCTVEDMALILHHALENDLCRQVLSTRIYTTSPTKENPAGIELSNWFLRRIEDKDTGGVAVTAAKTGFVQEAGSCAASYGERADGGHWLCVTCNADSAWAAIYDHVALYSTYCQ
ncbi:MAG: D-alanyl-D-alanine carboxypeptidase [Clostridiales bacterium]|nr:D-alanyl-D-alanine carboxypeptidase [Candidatus Cacconaster stercorequi]